MSIARALAAAGLFAGLALAQGTLADYQRGQGLQTKAQGLVVNVPGTPNWIGDSDRLWYSRAVKGGTEFVIVDAAMGGLHLGETSLAPSLARSLGPGMLLLVDQGLCSLELWHTFQATGAELVWRCRQDVKLPVLEVFADGSWRSELGAGHPKRKRVAVRVVDYRLDDPGRPGESEDYRLLTTVADPARAPAAELPALYPQRWEHETTLDELKTHQRGAGVVLRSKDPDGVIQEVWAHLLVHYAIRTLMHQAALDAGTGPDRISFTRTLRLVRRQVTAQAAFSPLTAGPCPVPGPG